ncbi:N-acetyltransferase [Nitratireductor mangrovi]|uniref:N-acetyltransferase n=1 Tax=Nitratireductor mangrovi TaxID=2599600 RepID=A0A5B8KWB7_9HYPH|nr:GNAT family N-acetyltransferase [Nitratireductor mangrovi]QDY99809.1 N-acetyltransferase [Nitratireductor mangrovi]
MNDNTPDIQTEETTDGGRYFVAMPNGEESRLTWRSLGDGVIDANHTFVPVPYREEGIAEALVERLVADARAKGRTIVPSCWFVADEFKRHAPAWDDLLASKS